jgi:hypothetical protein
MPVILTGMSITTADDRVTSYAPVVATTSFAADFPVFDIADISVFVNGIERFDFTVNATFSDGISTNATAVFAPGIIGDVDVVGSRTPRRGNRFVNGAPLPVSAQNLALDTVEAEVQEAARDLVRAHKAPYGQSGGVFTASDIQNAQSSAEIAVAAAAAAATFNPANFYTKIQADALLLAKLDVLQPFVDLASAATVNFGAQNSQNIRITGTVGITSFGTAAAGTVRNLRFAGALTLTHNATSLILPNGGANVVTAAGDALTAVSLGSGNWYVLNYQRATPGSTKFAILQDQKASGTGGGATVANAWTIHALTTEVADADNIVTLASNLFTITVDCWADVRMFMLGGTGGRLRIYNVTDSVVAFEGENGYGDQTYGGAANLTGSGKLLATKQYRLEYYSKAVVANGLGIANTTGAVEIYASVTLRGLAA